ncbi:Seven TM Receptor [Caenorhabditis elegans]|uniref:Seven TM Receptor n=1 Tax=Caenorhabditis elegans TaxID=6239 RepID=A0A0K3AVG3_CAEEL|nr:Seven TM Receptor [Caenorhabditis elegans]CTQ86782.1 Seven TM Receptor [Caenorhabditis elegans]|eukprot:NP_001300083.1 Uncharacterized protein CELE_F22F7.12 [Caenorhabditis elegans]
MSLLLHGLALIAVHYLAIVYFGVQMSRHMKQKLQNFSATYQRLQQQFFRALIVQTLAPTFLYVLPAGPVLLAPLLSPLLGFNISMQTGLVCTVFTLYSPFDSIAFMVIVSEYRKIIQKQLTRTYPVPHQSSTGNIALQKRVKVVQEN